MKKLNFVLGAALLGLAGAGTSAFTSHAKTVKVNGKATFQVHYFNILKTGSPSLNANYKFYTAGTGARCVGATSATICTAIFTSSVATPADGAVPTGTLQSFGATGHKWNGVS